MIYYCKLIEYHIRAIHIPCVLHTQVIYCKCSRAENAHKLSAMHMRCNTFLITDENRNSTFMEQHPKSQ